ncbi:carboxymuconolactone decarboxylase family protein [Corynebacterium uterequi]|uniref:Alkylhydroperoxidase AhpD family core domain n=1 Tax=Corynebacterium uterequi TaxID=1072256 RepID=A0A0G3HDY1_9CORY|nr:carboxymuconolactone decarboxylase family protein [Corynebacterium uterequi]AKK11524.1 alkylhydroperoxidase AhpD family core domain [Corynebacterium uterequi]
MVADKKPRPFLDKTNEDIYQAMSTVAKLVRKTAAKAGVPRALLELVNVRVSQLNGCPTCLSVHVPSAEQAGVKPEKIMALPSWRNADIYSAEERVALALAEALTVPAANTHVLDSASVDIRDEHGSEVFTQEQLAAVEWSIITINTFNRISIASGHPILRPKS